jgi:hypothetical protein
MRAKPFLTVVLLPVIFARHLAYTKSGVQNSLVENRIMFGSFSRQGRDATDC